MIENAEIAHATPPKKEEERRNPVNIIFSHWGAWNTDDLVQMFLCLRKTGVVGSRGTVEG